MKAIGNNRNIRPEYPTTHSSGVASNTNRSHLEEELKRRVERLERYSRDFNIRVVGVVEQFGEDCLLIIRNYLILLCFEDDLGDIENAHRTLKKKPILCTLK